MALVQLYQPSGTPYLDGGESRWITNELRKVSAAIATVTGGGVALSVAVPASGGSVVITQGIGAQVVNPAAALAALTITSPAAPTLQDVVSQNLEIIFTKAVTTLTWVAGTGTTYAGAAMPTTVAAGAVVRLKWVPQLAQWVHVIQA